MSKETQPSSRPKPTTSAPSTATKPNVNKWTLFPHASTTEPLRKQMISELVISNSPRISLQPIFLKSNGNGFFGRVILDSAVEPFFATCLACKKILHFQNSHNVSGNLQRHLRICPARRRRSSCIRLPGEESNRLANIKGTRKTLKRTMLDQWFDKDEPSPSNKSLRVYSPSSSSDSSDTSD